MSLATVQQLYADLKHLLPQSGPEKVTTATVDLYNINLAEAKTTHPQNIIINTIPEVPSGGALTRDLFICVGQLKSALEEEQPISFGVV